VNTDVIEVPAWTVDAACASPAVDPAWFWVQAKFTEGRRTCFYCPGRDQCLNWALANNEHAGLWGGYSPIQRRRILRGLPPGPVWEPPENKLSPREPNPKEAALQERIAQAHRLSDEGFTIHSLRHTFATTLAAKGVHPSTAQKMLGHSDIRMTLAIYTHATDGMQDYATAALEEAFS
jgi:hypothetical protein